MAMPKWKSIMRMVSIKGKHNKRHTGSFIVYIFTLPAPRDSRGGVIKNYHLNLNRGKDVDEVGSGGKSR